MTPPICDNDCFEAVSKTRCELLVPKGCYNYYWVAPVWSDFNKIKESDFSDIDDIAIDEVMVAVDNRCIVIRGVTNNRQVNIFQTDGTLVHQAKSDGETMHYMPAASGVYIVVIDNKTYKLMVR